MLQLLIRKEHNKPFETEVKKVIESATNQKRESDIKGVFNQRRKFRSEDAIGEELEETLCKGVRVDARHCLEEQGLYLVLQLLPLRKHLQKVYYVEGHLPALPQFVPERPLPPPPPLPLALALPEDQQQGVVDDLVLPEEKSVLLDNGEHVLFEGLGGLPEELAVLAFEEVLVLPEAEFPGVPGGDVAIVGVALEVVEEAAGQFEVGHDDEGVLPAVIVGVQGVKHHHCQDRDQDYVPLVPLHLPVHLEQFFEGAEVVRCYVLDAQVIALGSQDLRALLAQDLLGERHRLREFQQESLVGGTLLELPDLLLPPALQLALAGDPGRYCDLVGQVLLGLQALYALHQFSESH